MTEVLICMQINMGTVPTAAGKSSRRLRIASQAEILRAHQRDDEFVKQLEERLSSLLNRFGGYRSLLRSLQSDIPVKLIYFLVTSGLGNQTLGEEYTGIVQADLRARNVPSFTARLLAALLEFFGEQGLIKILERLRVAVNNPHNQLRPEAATFLNNLLKQLKVAIPLLILVHKGLFYTFGRYYSLGKRVAGVDYAKVQGQRSTDGVSWGLRLLGVATLGQCALRFWQSVRSVETDASKIEFPENNTGDKCQLCLEAVQTTATPCGHLFCWECLADWLRTRPQCPLCREHVTPWRIVYLMNL